MPDRVLFGNRQPILLLLRVWLLPVHELLVTRILLALTVVKLPPIDRQLRLSRACPAVVLARLRHLALESLVCSRVVVRIVHVLTMGHQSLLGHRPTLAMPA